MGGSVAAFMNRGGLRADLVAAEPGKTTGTVTYADVFAVQPFTNLLVTMDLTGADILAALSTPAGPTLQVSGVTYSYDITHSPMIDAATVMLSGQPLDLSATYRVTTNNFVAGGGDGYTPFANGTNVTTQGIDLDAFVNYLGAISSMSSPLAPPTPNRVTGNGCL
jgi:5'-nucleotidase